MIDVPMQDLFKRLHKQMFSTQCRNSESAMRRVLCNG